MTIKKLPLKFSAHVFVVVPYPPMSISHPPHVIKQWRRSGMKLPDCMCCKHSSGMRNRASDEPLWKVFVYE